MVNLYDFFLSNCHSHRATEAKSTLVSPVEQIFNEKRLRLTKIYNPDTKLLTKVNFYDDEGRCYRADRYDLQGCLSCSFFLTQKAKIQSAHYYRKDGSLAMVWQYPDYEITNREPEPNHIVIFDKSGTPTNSFLTKAGLHRHLLRLYLNSFSHQDQLNVIMDREFPIGKYLADGSVTAKVKCVILLHSTHHITDDDGNSIKLQRLQELSENDGVIALTLAQAEDIKQEFGDYGNVYYPSPYCNTGIFSVQ